MVVALSLDKGWKWNSFKGEIFGIFFCTLFNTASYAAPQIHCVGGCCHGIEPRTIAALAFRRSNHFARSYPRKGILSADNFF
jgi:hypothetical protein